MDGLRQGKHSAVTIGLGSSPDELTDPTPEPGD
jgi:hypothetical protein